MLIARGVAFEPTVLLLDEPASGLDRDARIELDALIERIAADLTLVCTAHVEDDLPAAIEHVVLLEHGAIVSAGRRLDADRRDEPVMRTVPLASETLVAASTAPGRRRASDASPSAAARGRCRSSRSTAPTSGSARGTCCKTSLGISTRISTGS